VDRRVVRADRLVDPTLLAVARRARVTVTRISSLTNRSDRAAHHDRVSAVAQALVEAQDSVAAQAETLADWVAHRVDRRAAPVE
jgi:hypothetical protein